MAKPSDEKVWMSSLPGPSIELPRDTAYGFMRSRNRSNENEYAIEFYGSRMTYRELWDLIDSIAKALTSMGIKEGDVVTMVATAVPDSIALIYAMNKIGAVTNTIDPRMDEKTIADRAKDANTRKVFVMDAVFSKAGNVLRKEGFDVIVIPSDDRFGAFTRFMFKHKAKISIDYGPGVIRWSDFIASGKDAEAAEVPFKEGAVVAITYTGGTTGTPKGVMLTNESMNAVVINFLSSGFDIRKGDSFLGIIPIFSSYGLVTGLHLPLTAGVRLIAIPKFNPEEFGMLVNKLRPNHMISTPAFYEMLMESKEVQDMDLSFVRTMGCGGDTMNEGLEARFRQFMKDHNSPYCICPGYGMSEVASAASFCSGKEYRARSSGRPSSYTVLGVFDPDSGEELGYNEVGEVCVSGPTLMKGYWNRPEETADIMRRHQDGKDWIHSGDLGYLDEEGFLFIVGRLKRMITRFDGHKVYPVVLEGLIQSNPCVANCSVIGVRDRGHGQGFYPFGIVELKPGYDGEVTCRKLMDKVNSLSEERGMLVGLIPVEKIPLTGMGKNDYILLEKQYSEYDYTGRSGCNGCPRAPAG